MTGLLIFYRVTTTLLLLGSLGLLVAVLWAPQEWLRLLVTAALVFGAAVVTGAVADDVERQQRRGPRGVVR